MLIITVRKQLEQLFGTDGYTRVRFALDDYAESAGALVLAVDDSDDCAALGLAAVSGTDSGTIVLAVRGARTKLGSDATDGLLIVGGDSVVPHFQITNPVSDRILDEDTVVFSDNPYGAASETLEQYLAPSFPVGRLVQPDNTADNFVTLIKGLTAQHTSGRPNNDGAVMVVNEDWIDYSKRAAGSLPGPQSWHISPGYEMNAADAARAILYFNLHGFSGEIGRA